MTSQPHEFMPCRPGSCALPHPMDGEQDRCHWPYGNVYFGGTAPYHAGDPICLLTEAQHEPPCWVCDPAILGGSRCATGDPICDAHRAELGLPVSSGKELKG